MRYELSDYEWTAIKPMLRNKPRGVRRVNDRRVLNGIFWFCVQVRHGAICQRHMVPAPLVTTALFVGGGLASKRFFNKIKQCRRVATRYDKLAANYLAFVKLASIRIWLRAIESTP